MSIDRQRHRLKMAKMMSNIDEQALITQDRRQEPANSVTMSTRNKFTHLKSSSIVIFLTATTIIFATNLITPTQCQSQSSSISNNNNNNNLVNPEQVAALPLQALIRQPLQQDPTLLDNVIESTTATTNFNLPYSQQQQLQPQPQQTCQLPPTWMGKWYQSNKEPIRVTSREISDKGLCRDKKGDKYLFEYTKYQQQPCLVCLVINERHLNVLQYKESSCQPIPARYMNRTTNGLIVDDDHALLDSICSDITGDAQLESLFRLDTPAIECPINGKYHFTYDNCREPRSSLDSCIDKKQLNFKFSACPDVPGSESKSEVLKCYADWSEGNNYYMIGRLEHASNHQDKGKFRCFVYERSADGEYIQMAQSLEESCYGLINANEGPKTLRLTARQPTNHECYFPSFIKSQSENWLSVDNSLIYMFNQNSSKYQVKETKEGNVIEEATCLQQFTHPTVAVHPHSLQQQQQPAHHHVRSSNNQQVITTTPTITTTTTSRRYPPSNFNQVDQSQQQQQQQVTSRSVINDVVYLVQITKTCYTIDYCVRFHRRSSGIVQIDYFEASPESSGHQRCRNAYHGIPKTQIITSTNLEQQRCPFEGAYTIEAPLESDFSYNPSNIFICPRQSFLTAQCDHPSRLRIHYKCAPAKYMIKNLYCLGSWTANGLVRLILADDERQKYTAWYRDYGALPQATSPATPTTGEDEHGAAAQTQYLTRSQQLLGLSTSPASVNNHPNNNQAQMYNSLAPIVDLQIALITPPPTVAKPMQVRLTRRNQCSEIRSYLSQGSFGQGYGSSPLSSPSSSSMSSYQLSPPGSSAATSSLSSLISLDNHRHYHQAVMMLMAPMVVTLFTMILSLGPQGHGH